MNRAISTLMQKQVVTVSLDATVNQVEDILKQHNLSCLPVIDADGHCFGMISAADLIYFHRRLDSSPKVGRAWEVCSHKVIEVACETTVREVTELMVEHKIHHIIVTDGEQIKGIVSSFDIMDEFILRKCAKFA